MYDALIIGSGLGGLTVAAALSKEGMNVCVVEKELRTGGCLQCYRRNGVEIDTGIHYMGSMHDGEPLNQYFRYLGVWDKLHLQRLDEKAFDIIRIGGRSYPFAMEPDRFAERLTELFPKEEESIKRYVTLLEQIGRTIGLDQLRKGRITSGETEDLYLSAWEQIGAITNDRKLQQVLAGNAILYGGHPQRSGFYAHAMVNDSYLHGACRFIGTSRQLAEALTDVIRTNGGTIRTGSPVASMEMKEGEISSVRLNSGERIETRRVISTIHPAILLDMIGETQHIRKALRSRISSLRNSYGLFSAALLQRPKSTPYLNHNIFLHKGDDVWHAACHPEDTSVSQCMITMQPQAGDDRYTNVICLISPMYFSEVERWKDSIRGHRGELYEAFKRDKANELIALVEKDFPGMTVNTEHIDCTTPLTYRDYTGTPEGSAYGIVKDYHNPLASLLSVKTHIPNLFLAGQNVNLHGALGVTLTSMLTCAEILGNAYLADKIKEA